ncbi:hypothetical protein KR093_010117 [Drosophila rubida]|uniref:Secreted protein n=1 Tax=Drosophila rubida TaxID=30044 RepID=A0AAD4PME4_9MUSC|nr:hypothetical protein KR093_010117 [Drosophila rubida]
MKWFSLSLLLLLLVAMFALLAAAPSGECSDMLIMSLVVRLMSALAGQIRIRTSSTQRVYVRNGNIRWNGDCHNCNIRTTKNTAEVTSTRRKEIVRRF